MIKNQISILRALHFPSDPDLAVHILLKWLYLIN